jgi:hypothetical protein
MGRYIGTILKDILEFDKIRFTKADLVIIPTNYEDLNKIDFPGTEFGCTIESKDGTLQKYINFNYHYDQFPLYFKPHDIKMTNHVLYYHYAIEYTNDKKYVVKENEKYAVNEKYLYSIYIIDREYFEERNKNLEIFKDIFIRSVDNCRYSTNTIYSLDKKAYGAHHIYQINSKEDDNSIQVINFQKGGRNDDSYIPGVLDIDLLYIVKDRLESFLELSESINVDNSYSNEALDLVKEAIHKLEERYKIRVSNDTLGKSDKQ